MYRFALAVILSTQAAAALAAGVCSVSGTAFDADGRPVRDAVVRLTDLQTRQVAYSAADANAAFVLAFCCPCQPLAPITNRSFPLFVTLQ